MKRSEFVKRVLVFFGASSLLPLLKDSRAALQPPYPCTKYPWYGYNCVGPAKAKLQKKYRCPELENFEYDEIP